MPLPAVNSDPKVEAGRARDRYNRLADQLNELITQATAKAP
tara:strand:+ start:8412 stop:8534 length:123 start_codon:yes stop_codon:yes gene_type:complete